MSMISQTQTNTSAPPAGPFHPGKPVEANSTLSRALVTSLLALYPVLATVGVVLIGMAYSAAT